MNQSTIKYRGVNITVEYVTDVAAFIAEAKQMIPEVAGLMDITVESLYALINDTDERVVMEVYEIMKKGVGQTNVLAAVTEAEVDVTPSAG